MGFGKDLNLIALADGETTPEVFEAVFDALPERGDWPLARSVLSLAKSRRDLQRRVEQLEAVQSAMPPKSGPFDRRLVESAVAFMLGYLGAEPEQHPEAIRLLRDVEKSLAKQRTPARIERHHGLSSARIYIGAMPLRITVHNGDVLVDEGDRQAIAEAMETTWLAEIIEQLEDDEAIARAGAGIETHTRVAEHHFEGRRSALSDVLARLRKRLER